MIEKLLDFVSNMSLDRRLASLDEAATKQGVVLRILSLLGWDTFSIEEVCPEYSVGEKKVDYALRHNNSNKVFIEVKRVGEDLEKHQEQLLSYSFQEGVKLAILTNGITWWFYLPLHEGSWDQRKFYTVEIYDQNPEEISQKFLDFLSKENVISGKALENAENVYKGKQKEHLIKETLPKAWNKIIEGPDKSLMELIAETTEKLCGHKPDDQTVKTFIASNIQKIVPLTIQPQRTLPPGGRTELKTGGTYINKDKLEETYTNKNILSFTFKGNRYEVNSWKDMLVQLCNIMLDTHRLRFNQVLVLRGRKRPYFSKNPNDLRTPKKILGTDIYVEVNLSANNIVRLSKDILSLFGYRGDDLSIEAR
jgi:predicted type IV restriction endonuclease